MSARKPKSEKIANIPPFGLRMPAELKSLVEEAARDHANSLNSEIVSRLYDSFEFDKRESDDEEERERLWREIHRRDAKIRQVEEEAYGREQNLKDAAAQWKEFFVLQNDLTRKYALLSRSLCHDVIAHRSNIPAELLELAEDMLSSFKWLRDDDTVELVGDMIEGRLAAAAEQAAEEMQEASDDAPADEVEYTPVELAEKLDVPVVVIMILYHLKAFEGRKIGPAETDFLVSEAAAAALSEHPALNDLRHFSKTGTMINTAASVDNNS